jgi:importin subunit alpha-6/7
MDVIQPMFPALASIVQHNTDGQVLTDACWALSYLSDGPNERVQALIDTQVTRRLVDLLGGERALALVPALRTIGNIVTGDDTQTQVAINCGALQQLRKLLSHSQLHRPAIVKEACWALSNVTAGTKEQVDAVIASGNVQELIRLLDEGDTNIKKEAAWAISNAASCSEPTQIAHLVQLGCVKPLTNLLVSIDSRIVMVALEGIKYILMAGQESWQERNLYAIEVESAGGLDSIEELQIHCHADVQERAVHILMNFFEVEPEEENVAPEIDAGRSYAFQQPAVTTAGTMMTFDDV